MRSSMLLITLTVSVTVAALALSAQSALEQLKAYSESSSTANKAAAPAASKEAAPATQAKATTAPGDMPDAGGIRLGIPLREAFTILQGAHPKEMLGTNSFNMPELGIEKRVLSDFFYPNSFAPTAERVEVFVTPPPNQQVVWKVKRSLLRQKIYRANVLSSLREKYGKETATNPLVANDQQIIDMWWFLDEQGHPAKVPAVQGNYASAVDMAADCLSALEGSWFAPNNLVGTLESFEREISDPKIQPTVRSRAWCFSSGIAIHASVPPTEIVTQFQVDIFNNPLAMRSAKAEMAAVNDASKHQQQQEINQSKQARPKL